MKDDTLTESPTALNISELNESLRQKDVLIREISHRTKNSLQIISSLFDLQMMNEQEIGVKEKLIEGFGRFQVMVLIYKRLTAKDSYSRIDIGKFIPELYQNVMRWYTENDQAMKSETDISELFLELDIAIPLGLIVNELLNNSFRSPFVKTNSIQISMTIIPNDSKELCFVYRDNGRSVLNEFEASNPSPALGTRLISGLSKQIGGRMECFYDNGNVFRIFFRKPDS